MLPRCESSACSLVSFASCRTNAASSTAAMPLSQNCQTAVAAPPESESSSSGQPSSADASIMSSVFGPPCTTSSTTGMPLVVAYTRSSFARSGISCPHAATPAEYSRLASTKTWCVWYGFR